MSSKKKEINNLFFLKGKQPKNKKRHTDAVWYTRQHRHVKEKKRQHVTARIEIKS